MCMSGGLVAMARCGYRHRRSRVQAVFMIPGRARVWFSVPEQMLCRSSIHFHVVRFQGQTGCVPP